MIPVLKSTPCEFKLFGKIEKIFATYGFVVTADGQRYFFHFGTCITKPEFFRVGDDVEFTLGEDPKTHRLHAQKLYKCTSTSAVSASLASAVNRAALFSMIPIQMESNALQFSIGQQQQSATVSSSSSSVAAAMLSYGVTSQLPFPKMNNGEENLRNHDGESGSKVAVLQLQQHPTASVQCVGLILSLPNANANIRGYIACEIAGNPTFVRYQYTCLKFPQEKPLLTYGAKVNLIATWHAGSGTWTAKDLLPYAQLHKGVVRFVGAHGILVECLTNEKRNEFTVRGKNLKQVEVGTLVDFIIVQNENGEVHLSRLLPSSMSVNVALNELTLDPYLQHQVNMEPCENVEYEFDAPMSDSPNRHSWTDEVVAFSPVSSSSLGSVDLMKKNDNNQSDLVCYGKEVMDDVNVGFTQTRPLMSISNLPSTPSSAYEKAREAWFSVMG